MSIWDTWAADPRYSQLVSDPTYLQATPLFKKQMHDLFYDYGIQPTAQQQADYGTGAVEANPYGIAQLLQQDLTKANHATYNAANAAGLEESGAAAGALNANQEGYKRGYAGQVANLGRSISDLLGNYQGTVGSIFDRLQQNPVVSAVQYPGDVGPAPGAATGAGTAYPTPQQPYTRTGSEAGWNTVFDTKPKKPKAVSFATALHSGGRM